MSKSTFNPPVRPKTSARTATIRTLVGDFGDGYAQTVADGLNANTHELTLTWPELTQAQADAIEAFFNAQLGQSFLWRANPSVDILSLWRCLNWSVTYETGTASATATLKEAFV